MAGSGSYGAGLDPQKAADAHGRGAPATAGRWLIDLLIQGDLPAPVERLLLESAAKGQDEALRRLAHRIVTLPEFQLS